MPGWVAVAQFATQPLNRKSANRAASRAQQNALEIQIEYRLRYSEIDAEGIPRKARHAKAANHDRPQKGSVDFVDGNNEPFLAGFPPGLPPNALGNGPWLKPQRQQRGQKN